MSAQPNFVTAVNNSTVQLTSTTVASQVLFTAGASGSWLRAVNIYSNAPVAYKLKFKLSFSATSIPTLCEVTVPPVGKDGPKPINLMDPAFIPAMDPAPNRGLMLASGQVVRVEVPGTPYLKLADVADTNLEQFAASDATTPVQTVGSTVNADSLILSIPDDKEGYLELRPAAGGDPHYTRRVKLRIDPSTNILVSPEGLQLIFQDNADASHGAQVMTTGITIGELSFDSDGTLRANGSVVLSSTIRPRITTLESPSTQLISEAGLAAGDAIDIIAFGGNF